jgi:1-acyl-sn-glycerol-3-phosphate acyltransferase
VEFLPAIPAGLPQSEFIAKLRQSIEEATDRLIAEALAGDPGLAVNLATKIEGEQKAD